MKGLIIKDFINLRKSMIMFAIVTVAYFILGITSDNPYFFTGMLSVLLAITTISLFSYDDMAKWDVYALTMPLSKEKIIQARYLMMLLLALIGAVLSSVLTIVINIYLKKDMLLEGFKGIGIGTMVILAVLCTIIPFVIKLGVERARIILVIVYIVPFIVVMLIDKIVDSIKVEIPQWLVELVNVFVKNIFILAPLVVLLVLVISYSISLRIFNKKEF